MPIIADLGYVGVEGITAADRCAPGGTLADRQKSANQSLAGIRSIVEQTIAYSETRRSSRLTNSGSLCVETERFFTVVNEGQP